MVAKAHCLLFSSLSIFGIGVAFTPDITKRIFVSWTWDDATHASIAEAGIRRVLEMYFLAKKGKLDPTDKVEGGLFTWLFAWFLKNKDDSPCLLGYIPYQMAIKAIQLGIGFPDMVPSKKDRADYHFDAEKFDESNQIVMENLAKAKAYLMSGRWFMARVAFGEALHTLQDFYSHSNWVEMEMKDTNKGLGNKNGFGVPIADKKTATCKDCPSVQGFCVGNILPTGKLTSGYFLDHLMGIEIEETDRFGRKVPKPDRPAKCSHGGPFDGSTDEPPIGGINKDTSDPSASPHGNRHKEAALLAELSTAEFLDAFRLAVGDAKFEEFLGISWPWCSTRFKRSMWRFHDPPRVQNASLFTVVENEESRQEFMHTHYGFRHSAIVNSAILDTSQNFMQFPIDNMVGDFVLEITGDGLPFEKDILVTAPADSNFTFKTPLRTGSVVYVRVAAPKPGLWRLELPEIVGRHGATVLGISHWDAIIDVLVTEERMRHTKEPGLRILMPEESPQSGSTLYLRVMSPVDGATTPRLELHSANGNLIRKATVARKAVIKDGFVTQLFQAIVPSEKFRLVVKATDDWGYAVVRLSETVYTPIVADIQGHDAGPISDGEMTAEASAKIFQANMSRVLVIAAILTAIILASVSGSLLLNMYNRHRNSKQ